MSAYGESQGSGTRGAVRSVGELSDRIIACVRDLFAQHGWTMVLLVVLWYNLKDPAKRRWRKWRNEQSLAHANRPERRSVLDRERERAVAQQQVEALKAARAAKAKIT